MRSLSFEIAINALRNIQIYRCVKVKDLGGWASSPFAILCFPLYIVRIPIYSISAKRLKSFSVHLKQLQDGHPKSSGPRRPREARTCRSKDCRVCRGQFNFAIPIVSSCVSSSPLLSLEFSANASRKRWDVSKEPKRCLSDFAEANTSTGLRWWMSA